jgi:hypothetical protein
MKEKLSLVLDVSNEYRRELLELYSKTLNSLSSENKI